MGFLGIHLGNWSCDVAYNRDYTDTVYEPNVTTVKTHICQIKCLLGRKFSDPELKLELDYVPFRVIEGPDGYPLVHGRCKGEDRAFTPVEILAMLISSLVFIGTNEYYHSSPSPCIGIPMYFTDQQKKDMFQAAKIAGLPASFHPLDETTAMVQACEELLVQKNSIVALVDIGHAGMQVCFAEFKGEIVFRNTFEWKSSMKILYNSYSRSLGGREFDKVLFKHFASKIRKEYNIDVSENSSACVHLSDACESLKIDLGKNNEASFCLKEFSGSIDVKGSITRKDFESLSISILKKIELALKKALGESRLNVEKIKFVQTFGKGCSILAINDILTKIFGQKLKNVRYNEFISEVCARQAEVQDITDGMIIDLETTGLKTSELVSRELNSEGEKAEDLEKFLWRRAMGEKGHLLTFLNDFLEKNMHRIGRSKKTKDESYWLSKAFKLGIGGSGIMYKGILQKISTFAINMLKEGSSQGAIEFNQEREDRTCSAENEKKQNNQDNANKERPDLQLELSEAQELMSERDDVRKEVELLRWSTEQQAPGSQCVGYFTEYSYSELQDATTNFHESFKLGEGGFGIVYKGILHNTTIAIKMLKEGSSQGAKEFNQEVEILSKVRHPNLVKLIGACSETHALIYEYLPNGSLEDRLRCKNNTLPLSWYARVRIASEICSALIFLHYSEPHGIVHGDLKPENILLDENNISKICDFGLSRQLNWTTSASIPYHWTDCPKGTFAYMDPEYFSTGKMTPQFDVYSFGILLLRLATCKSPMGIRQLVEEAQKKGTLKALIDASAGPWPFKEAKKMISLGLRCSDPMRKNRPDLSTKVWKELKSMANVAFASVACTTKIWVIGEAKI